MINNIKFRVVMLRYSILLWYSFCLTALLLLWGPTKDFFFLFNVLSFLTLSVDLCKLTCLIHGSRKKQKTWALPF